MRCRSAGWQLLNVVPVQQRVINKVSGANQPQALSQVDSKAHNTEMNKRATSKDVNYMHHIYLLQHQACTWLLPRPSPSRRTLVINTVWRRCQHIAPTHRRKEKQPSPRTTSQHCPQQRCSSDDPHMQKRTQAAWHKQQSAVWGSACSNCLPCNHPCNHACPQPQHRLCRCQHSEHTSCTAVSQMKCTGHRQAEPNVQQHCEPQTTTDPYARRGCAWLWSKTK